MHPPGHPNRSANRRRPAHRALLCLGRAFAAAVLAFATTIVIADDPAAAKPTPSVSPETLKSIEQGKQLFVAALKSKGKDRISGLRQSYQKLVEASERDDVLAPPRTIWAKMLRTVGDQKGAKTSLQQAVLENPDDPEAYVMLANDAVRAGQLAEAELTYRSAKTKLTGLGENHLRHRGLVAQVEAGLATIAQTRSLLATQGKRPELAEKYRDAALEHLKQWVLIAPDDANAHNQLATALLSRGDTQAAVAAFERARELNPELPITELRLTQSQIAKGDFDSAKTSLVKAIKDHPDDQRVRSTAADLFLVMGDLDAANEQIAVALKIDPNDLAANRLMSQVLRFRGQWADAADQLQELNNEHPTDFETANLLALTLSELESDEERRRAVSVATVNAQRFSAQTREGRRARITLIWAAFADGQTKVAKEALERLLSVGIESRQISGDEAYYLSRLLVEFGRPEVASTLLGNVLSRSNSFPKRADAEALAAQIN